MLWPYQAGNEKTPLCFKKICIKHRGGIVQVIPEKIFSCKGGARILKRTSFQIKKPVSAWYMTGWDSVIRSAIPNSPLKTWCCELLWGIQGIFLFAPVTPCVDSGIAYDDFAKAIERIHDVSLICFCAIHRKIPLSPTWGTLLYVAFIDKNQTYWGYTNPR